jgi:hypothetical protein
MQRSLRRLRASWRARPCLPVVVYHPGWQRSQTRLHRPTLLFVPPTKYKPVHFSVSRKNVSIFFCHDVYHWPTFPSDAQDSEHVAAVTDVHPTSEKPQSTVDSVGPKTDMTETTEPIATIADASPPTDIPMPAFAGTAPRTAIPSIAYPPADSVALEAEPTSAIPTDAVSSTQGDVARSAAEQKDMKSVGEAGHAESQWSGQHGPGLEVSCNERAARG